MADHVCDECEGTGRAGTWTCDGCGLVYDSAPADDECPECGDAVERDPCDACGGRGEREGCHDCGAPPDHCQCDARYEAWIGR